MNWFKAQWQGLVVGFVLAVVLLFATGHAQAADLGGNCCADLEDRIAELEATVARKGNRKVSLTITGQVYENIFVWDDGDVRHTQVQSNPNRGYDSRFQFVGEALIIPGVKAGYFLQVGVGGFENAFALPTSNGLDTNSIFTRQSFVYLKSDTLGGLSIGKQEIATYDLTGATAGANTKVAWTKMSYAPLVGGPLGSTLDLFDGGITDAVKYKSPRFNGFWVEGAWGNANDLKSGNSEGNLWDAAIKYDGEPIKNVKVDARVGYRNGLSVDTSAGGIAGLVIPGGANVQDLKVWGGSAGVMHMTSGIFANASYGDFDYSTLAPGAKDIKAWEVQAGVEQRLWHAGKTTAFVDYGETDFGFSGVNNQTVYGGGLVQHIDQAAMDLYASWKHFKDGPIFGTQASDAILVGAGMQF